ncbi:MAG: S49 family peptidase [Chromatiales bacterium]|nr:S49 family peptidase [Gammaproteobacteria bacterium]MCP5352380.1 S49 family peptidase [Chromatiales bacterium]
MSDEKQDPTINPGESPKRRDPHWERDLLNRIAFASINEQRRARRWNVFFKLLLAIYLFSFLAIYLNAEIDTGKLSEEPHTAMVDVFGVISAETDANAETIIEGLRDAFEDENTKAVIVRLDSPGGAPVQAGMINDEIKRLRETYPEIPVYAVIEDMCASGGYYIAAAADKVYADKASIVGSIGVRMDGFGFVDTMEKIGAERRLMTAGGHKGLLDPFLPVDEVEKSHIQSLLDDIHRQFIEVVKAGRGERLKDDERLYSGLIWTGEQALELGLVDGLGSADYVAREIVGVEDIVNFTPQPDAWERLADRLGAGAAAHFLAEFGIGKPQLR